MMVRPRSLRPGVVGLAVTVLMVLGMPVGAGARPGGLAFTRTNPPWQEPTVLPDFSGLAWIEENLFVAVHDTKHSKGLDQPRVSLLTLPTSQAGIQAQFPPIRWPEPHGPSNDFESIARIPGTRQMLLVESGDETGKFRRIFLANLDRRKLMLSDFIHWPVPITNVEGSAVARVGDRLIFLYAERAHGQSSTLIRWADLALQPLALGEFREVRFTSPGPRGPDSRPVSALEVDRAGHLYVASALDPGSNNGPFRSMVWRVGRLTMDAEGSPDLVLKADPEPVATLDGVKVESLAIRQRAGDDPELFVGMDDEYFGATMRLIPLSPSSRKGE